MSQPPARCGDHRVEKADLAWSTLVMTDLSRAERDEQHRLGLRHASIYEEVNKGRAFLLFTANKAAPLAIFGATEQGAIWFLPTQTMVEKHWRILIDREVISWVKRWQMSLDPARSEFFNGVTVEGAPIRKWLTRYVGADFLPHPMPTVINGHLAYPFLLYREPADVRR